jgi:uncharacterized protein (DUF433 family)
MRFGDDQVKRLQRLARQLGKSPSETSALLVEESLRKAEFGHVDFRNSPVGRQAYIQGSRLAVWQVISLLRSYNGDVEKTALHLSWPRSQVQAALHYAQAYPEEIETALDDQAACDFQNLKRMLPQAEEFVVSESFEKG